MDSILLEDNGHWVNQSIYGDFVSRESLDKAIKYLGTKEILALVGARRVGKSTLAKLLIHELLKSVEAKNIFFINLEKPEFIPYKDDASYLGVIFDAYLKLANPNREKKIYFFIDEVQIFQNWEIFVKSKYENSNIKFIITGSNASLLTSNYATVLTGRVLRLEIYSFNFREFLQFKKLDFSTKIQRAANKIEISRAMDEYLKWGGYYSVISNSDEMLKKEYLMNVAEDIILKDIVPRYNIKSSQIIRDLFYYLVSNAATTLNYSSLAKKLSVDPKMIKEYIGYFEDNFLIHTISAYHDKLTSQIKSAKKLYLSDNGFLNLGVNRTKNLGTALENLVFNELYKKDEKVTYRKDNQEVDFYTQNRLYQVAYDISDEKTKKRELNAFGEFKKEGDRCTLITYDANETILDVEVLSIDRFLLEADEGLNIE
ncbi:ATP-binding protein [Sulfurimonas sp. RIFOXYB12_FULL_35_9]|uniref:ATP-binding protein n=1 Tax=Sulfurimonas sp. RIFOXYB12_FULL_35_9 TaxID=1802256 RepID=UPI0008B43EF8|nr:ATP-binding protein [Sulfurimonas sp. RIFOXYB12_FULL_35_9]MBS4066977.1 ATP-binding protein [Sulfurimonas sp.]OHE06367.1 MAG: ATPase [Sulfurimonas sp. RIFOXYB12_FULL_35_9]